MTAGKRSSLVSGSPTTKGTRESRAGVFQRLVDGAVTPDGVSRHFICNESGSNAWSNASCATGSSPADGKVDIDGRDLRPGNDRHH
jgi:hypothetical protein